MLWCKPLCGRLSNSLNGRYQLLYVWMGGVGYTISLYSPLEFTIKLCVSVQLKPDCAKLTGTIKYFVRSRYIFN